MKKCINRAENRQYRRVLPLCVHRQSKIAWVGLFLAVLVFLCSKFEPAQEGFTLLKYHNADAKFLEDKIVTSVEESIQILDREGSVLQSYEGLSASWLYVEEESKSIVYSNHNKETRLLRYSDDYELLSDKLLFQTEFLAIDPILIWAEGQYFLTYTTIEGTINNPDPNGENGIYTVKLYASSDLENWEFLGDIISKNQNIEDGDLRYIDGTLYYFFEMEDYDRGPSKLCVMSSADGGHSFLEPVILVDAIGDNEMASCERTQDGWRLYFSSDMANLGESYQGACVYYRDFSFDFSTAGIYYHSDMPDNQAVRLYEVKEIDGKLHFLFARNYLTDCDLLLRVIEKEEKGE